MPITLGCAFRNKEGDLVSRNHGQGVAINDLSIAEIKQFIVCKDDSGNIVAEEQCTSTIWLLILLSSKSIEDEQTCTCENLEAEAKHKATNCYRRDGSSH